MKNLFRFSNLIGTVYKKGNISFTEDGNTVVCPVGNKISFYDLNNEKGYTLPVEARYDFVSIALSPNGRILVAADEGDINKGPTMYIINVNFRNILYKKKFVGSNIKCIKFSPDGKHFAISLDNKVFVYLVPNCNEKTFNPLKQIKQLDFSIDNITCIDWSHDSRLLAFGSEDYVAHVYAVAQYKNFNKHLVRGHQSSVVGFHFNKEKYDFITVASNGQVTSWQSDFQPEDLVLLPKSNTASKTKIDPKDRVNFSLISKLYTFKFLKVNQSLVTTTAFKKESKLLIVAFENGQFLLLDMNDGGSLIHSLSISDDTISACDINKSGEWLALGVSSHGQLLIWEWESETNILKQQSHFNALKVSAYSPDGSYIATGGEDGKVKLWSTHTSFCFLTFHEHEASITGICFTHSGKAVLSSSLDGTVRAFDMVRYRNFKTLTSPRPAQFSCLAVDSSGELVASGAQDVFEIFLWSLKTGRLLEILNGHTGPVVSLQFSSVPGSTTLVSTAWDSTVKIWDAINDTTAKETISLLSDGMFVALRPDGQQLAVATMDGQITMFNTKTSQQEASIDGKNDLAHGISDYDKTSARFAKKSKTFQTICYSADGKYILAGGQSKFVCIYYVDSELLVKKFEITQNRSFDAMDEEISRKKITRGGVNLTSIEDRDDNNMKNKVPGCRTGDLSQRSFKAEVRVTFLTYSPTGRCWAACSSEGLLIFSLDDDWLFDPLGLDEENTPDAVRKKLRNKDYSLALMMALKLNITPLIQEVVESIPIKAIKVICGSLVQLYVEFLLNFLGSTVESSRHVGLYVEWINNLMLHHGQNLKTRAPLIMPLLNTLQKSLSTHFNQLSKVCDHNDYMLSYILSQCELKHKRAAAKIETKHEIDELQSEDSDTESLGKSDADQIMEIY